MNRGAAHFPIWPQAVLALAMAAVFHAVASAGVDESDKFPPGLQRMPSGVFVECEDFQGGEAWTFRDDKLPGWSGRGYFVDNTAPVITRSPLSKGLTLPRPGKYNVWVRGYLGGRKENDRFDRRFAVWINGQMLDTTHQGLSGARYAWELAGSVDVPENCIVRIRVYDLGSSWAMVDCMLLTDELEFKPSRWIGNSTRRDWTTKKSLSTTIDCPEAKPYALSAAAKEHIEELSAGRHTYEVTMGGTIDGFNTVEYLDTYSGCKRQASKFEPNEYLVLQNVGNCDLVSPRITVGGRRDWHSADRILAGIFTPGMSDAEKAMAIYQFTASIEVQCHENNRRVGPPFVDVDSHPSRNTFKERADPVKAVNCYYCSGCSLSAANFVILCHHAGLIARAVWICGLDSYNSHCVAEAWHDGGWHLYDPELRVFYLNSDNTTVASYEQLASEPALVARTHHCGFANPKRLDWNSGYHEHYPPHVMPVEQWLSTTAMTLRPGETFIWRWDHRDKFRCGDNHRNRGDTPYQLANGKMIYRPTLAADGFRRGIVSALNMKPVKAGNEAAGLEPEVAGSPGNVIYKVRSPYPIVGGAVGGKFSRKTKEDACRIYVSVGQSDWVEVFRADAIGKIEKYLAIDEILDPRPTPAIYDYYVKFELRAMAAPADARLGEVYIESDVQMAATSLPSLKVGTNKVQYEDESQPGAQARIRHGWRESSATQPPLPPARPIEPADGAQVNLDTLKALAWEAAADPDGKPIADYHVQLGPRADMLHPVSPNFDRITFSSQPRWPLPEGWFVKECTYYWRVRAKSQCGAWSDWSPAWKFTIRQ